jgi:LysR family transcriptional regulator, glycine cleavage system transcriptional activator
VSVDLDSLRCFLAATETTSFRAAAARVALSPGAFSDRIRRLEEDLDARLFERTTRSARLTEAGRRLAPHARRLIEEASRCRDVVHRVDRVLPYELTLGTRFELGLSWLCPALDPLKGAHPERTLHLFMGDTPDLLSRVERGSLDAAVLSARLTSARLRYATLHPEPYVFVSASPRLVGPVSPAPGPLGPEDAPAHTLLEVSRDLPLFRYLLDALPDATPWPFAEYELLGGIGAIRYRALQGAGVAVLPAYFVRHDLEAGRLVRLMPEVELRSDAFRLVWRTDHPQQDRLLMLADELRALPLQ